MRSRMKMRRNRQHISMFLIISLFIWLLWRLSLHSSLNNYIVRKFRPQAIIQWDEVEEVLKNRSNLLKMVHSNKTIGKKLLTCRLPHVDPWDPEIVKHLDPNYRQLAKGNEACMKSINENSQIKDGKVQVNPNLLNAGNVCEFRCLHMEDDLTLAAGKWQNISLKPECDIVEVQCRRNAKSSEVIYSQLHTQIYSPSGNSAFPKTSANVRKTKNNLEFKSGPGMPDSPSGEEDTSMIERAPDVHLLILDSVGHTMFLRSLPNSTMWLRERMGAIPFPHLNKVGMNSRSNAFAMFMGLQISPIAVNPFGEEYKPPREVEEFHRLYLDNETFIAFEYAKRGYRTLMAEDWAGGAFTWPDYYGFKKPPTHHYMRPFQLRHQMIEGTLWRMALKLARNHILGRRDCPGLHVLNYLSQFIHAYEHQPKFSITWFTELTHNDPNGVFTMDPLIYNFLRAHEEKLDNAFLFVKSDHGLRHSSLRETRLGEIEDNNPAMFLVVPKHLRQNRRLMENLAENAKQLVTQFDVHSTLVDIAWEGSAWTQKSAFDRPSVDLQSASPFGSPLLFRFNQSQPRHCGTLHIPFEYCLCQLHTKDVTATERVLGMELAQIMVDKMNTELIQGNVTHFCAPLSLEKLVEMLEYEPKSRINLFKITYETFPGNGRFWGFIQLEDRQNVSKGFRLINKKFPRLNEYAKQAECIDKTHYLLGPYCYCQ